MPDSLKELVRQLGDIRTSFGPRAAAQRTKLLHRASRRSPNSASSLAAYHELLLFAAAYPDNPSSLRRIQFELKRVATFAPKLSRTAPERERLDESGIHGLIVEASFSLDLLYWLRDFVGRDVDINWDLIEDAETIEDFLEANIFRAAGDSIHHEGLFTHQLLDLVRGGRKTSSLQWLLTELKQELSAGYISDRAFDSLDVGVRFKLRRPDLSSTFLRFPRRKVSYQTSELSKKFRVAEMVARPIRQRTRPLPQKEALRLIDLARATLCIRGRETDPVTYANPKEITLCRLESGIDVALFGLLPKRRLSIESYIGFVVAKNRIPVGYGGAWILGQRAEIGVNIFAPFRGGESALIFAQIMRVYHQMFGPKLFLVAPYQFGQGNDEGLASGAFWFYYRLGFRPVDPKLAALAEREAALRLKNPKYRSSSRILRRLTDNKLSFPLKAGEKTEELDLACIGLAVANFLGKKFNGRVRLAECLCTQRFKRDFGRSLFRKRNPDEIDGLARLSVLAAALPNLKHWSSSEVKLLGQVLLRKGGTREADFIKAVQEHPKLIKGLSELEHIGRKIGKRYSH